VTPSLYYLLWPLLVPINVFVVTRFGAYYNGFRTVAPVRLGRWGGWVPSSRRRCAALAHLERGADSHGQMAPRLGLTDNLRSSITQLYTSDI